MVAWSLKCNIWSYIFLDFHKLLENCKKSISHLNTQFLYQQNAHFILYVLTAQNFNIKFCKNFIGLQRSIGERNFELKKFIKKQPDHKKKSCAVKL